MGAETWFAIGRFIKAIFVGVGTTSGVHAAYIVAVNVARVALLALVAKLTAPKLDLTNAALNKLLTIASPIAPQTFIYGEDMVSGPLLYANTGGTDNKDLYKVVALTGHECDSVIKYRIDDTDVLLSEVAGAFSGSVISGKFNGVAEVAIVFGTQTQVVFSALTAAFGTLFNSAHTGRGWCMMLWKFSIVDGSEDAFEDGVPTNLRAVLRGKKCYDPRRDFLNDDPDFDTAKLDFDSNNARWFGDNAQTTSIDAAFTQAASTLSLTDNDAATEDIFSERFPVDTTKLYTAHANVRQTAGDRVNILAVAFYDSGGSLITPGAETGWANLGANYFEFFASAVFPGSFTVQSQQFGTSGGQIPAGVVTMALVGELVGAGSTSTTIDIQDMAIFENTLAARHGLGDDTTWEWSDNPAVCLADFIRDDKFGMKEDDDRMDWPLVIDAAQINDQLVAIPTAATQKRYTVNATFNAAETRGEVRDQILGAMMGRMVFSQGLWRMWAGAAIVPNVTLTEANLGGAIQLQAQAGAKERYNRVQGKFIDASRDYTANSYPEQRSATQVTDDGGEVRQITADMLHTNNTFEAQRKAIIFLKQSRNQRVVVFQGNYSCFRIQPGSTCLLTVAEYGFAGEKFFITEWAFNADGIQLTLVQEVDSVWADPLEADYTVRSATGALAFTNTGVPPPTALTASLQSNRVTLNWTNPPANLYHHIEIHASADNVRANAVIIGETSGAIFFETLIDDNQVRFYWVRAVDNLGRLSTFEPDLTTTTAEAQAAAQTPGEVLDPDFDLTNAANAGSFWGANAKDTGGTRDPEVNLLVGGGANSSNAFELIFGNGSNATTEISTISRFRLTTGWVEVQLRYKSTIAIPEGPGIEGWKVVFRGYSAQVGGVFGTNTTSHNGMSLPATAGVWTTVRYAVFIPDDDDAQFWTLTVGGFQDPGPGTDFGVVIDSLFVTTMPSSFGDTTHLTDVQAGAVPVADAVTDAQKVLGSDGAWDAGTRNSPINTQNDDYTLVLGDRGKTIRKATSLASKTHTIPDNGSVAFDIGDWVAFRNSGTVNMTIAITTDELKGTDGATGSRTLGPNDTALIQKVEAAKWEYSASDL